MGAAVTPGYTLQPCCLAEINADCAGDAPDKADSVEFYFLPIFQFFGALLLQKGNYLLALFLAQGDALVVIVGSELKKLRSLQVRRNFSHLSPDAICAFPSALEGESDFYGTPLPYFT